MLRSLLCVAAAFLVGWRLSPQEARSCLLPLAEAEGGVASCLYLARQWKQTTEELVDCVHKVFEKTAGETWCVGLEEYGLSPDCDEL